MGRNTYKWHNSQYKIMNKGGRSPHSLLPLLFLFFVCVYRLPPFSSFFFFYSIALFLHGPIWASSNGPMWAWCIGLSLLFFGITIAPQSSLSQMRWGKWRLKQFSNKVDLILPSISETIVVSIVCETCRSRLTWLERGLDGHGEVIEVKLWSMKSKKAMEA